MDLVPPSPGPLLRRWRGLSLLCALRLGENEFLVGFSLRVDAARGAASGMLNDFLGGYARLSARVGGGAVLYGGTNRDEGRSDAAPALERRARAAIARLPAPLPALVDAEARGSLGWTFAMHAPTPDGAWRDLTGADPGCTAFSLLPDAGEVLLPNGEAADFCMEQYEIPHGKRDAVLAVLRGEPLTAALVRTLLRKRPRDGVVHAALAMGYPVGAALATRTPPEEPKKQRRRRTGGTA